jgi:hypothetical protein
MGYTSIYSPPHNFNHYVLEAHILRTRGRSAIQVTAIILVRNTLVLSEKSQSQMVRQPQSNGPRPVNLKHQSTDQVDLN